MGILALIISNPVVAAGTLGVAITAATGGYFYMHHKIYAEGETAGKAEVQTLWDAEKAARILDATKRTEALANDFKETIRVKDVQITGIAKHLDSALTRLSDRAPRHSARLPGNPAVTYAECKGATGAELSRPDAEFLTREAARGDQFRAYLEACYGEVDSIRSRLSPAGIATP